MKLYYRRAISVIVLSAAITLLPFLSYAEWPANAYNKHEINSAISALYGGSPVVESKNITLNIPEIAENGAMVPVKVISDLKNIESISIFVEKNPSPLAANFKIFKNQQGFVNTRIKLNKTSVVKAVVKADGKLYSAERLVKITIPGCSGSI